MNTLKARKRQPHVCLKCGKQDVVVQHFGDVVDFKGLTLEVHGLAQTQCKACGYTWTTDGQEQDNLALLRAAFAEERDRLRERDGLLTGEKIEYALTQLGLTKAEAAEVFGGGPNAFSKYVSGDVLQSAPMDRLIRLTVAFGKYALGYLRMGKDAPLQLYAATSGFMLPSTGALPLQFDLSESRLVKATAANESMPVKVTAASHTANLSQ